MTAVALTLPLERRSAVRTPRRDLVAPLHGGLTLRVSLVAADRPGHRPLHLPLLNTGMWIVVRPDEPRAWVSDYGFWPTDPSPIVTERVAADPAEPWRIDVPVPGGLGVARARWTLMASIAGQTVELCHGVLHPGAATGGLALAFPEPPPPGTGTGGGGGTGGGTGASGDGGAGVPPGTGSGGVPAPANSALRTDAGAALLTSDNRRIAA